LAAAAPDNWRLDLKQVLTFLESLVILALVVAGLVGISYNLFRGGGWFDAALERIAEIVFGNITVSLVVATVTVVLIVIWLDRRVAKGRHSKRLATLVLYALMAAGAYFIGHYALFGTL
jgi:hypothetical protein